MINRNGHDDEFFRSFMGDNYELINDLTEGSITLTEDSINSLSSEKSVTKANDKDNNNHSAIVEKPIANNKIRNNNEKSIVSQKKHRDPKKTMVNPIKATVFKKLREDISTESKSVYVKSLPYVCNLHRIFDLNREYFSKNLPKDVTFETAKKHFMTFLRLKKSQNETLFEGNTFHYYDIDNAMQDSSIKAECSTQYYSVLLFLKVLQEYEVTHIGYGVIFNLIKEIIDLELSPLFESYQCKKLVINLFEGHSKTTLKKLEIEKRVFDPLEKYFTYKFLERKKVAEPKQTLNDKKRKMISPIKKLDKANDKTNSSNKKIMSSLNTNSIKNTLSSNKSSVATDTNKDINQTGLHDVDRFFNLVNSDNNTNVNCYFNDDNKTTVHSNDFSNEINSNQMQKVTNELNDNFTFFSCDNEQNNETQQYADKLFSDLFDNF